MRKYIKQLIDRDFVYPNKERYLYDTEMIHTINDRSVSGVVTTFSATTVSDSSITLSVNLTWTKNGADPFISDSNYLHYASIHGMAEGQLYYKPWITLAFFRTDTLNVGSASVTSNLTITPDQFGLTTFSNGTYYFEVRFIGKRSIYPVCVNLDIEGIPSPEPTPTPTATPTPTPTATSPEPTPTPTPTPTATQTSLYYTLTACNEGGPAYDILLASEPISSQRYIDPISTDLWIYDNNAGTIAPQNTVTTSLQIVSGQTGCGV